MEEILESQFLKRYTQVHNTVSHFISNVEHKHTHHNQHIQHDIKPQTKRAVLFGIRYKNTENELEGCVNDANNMGILLQTEFGYLEQNITIVTDDDDVFPPTKKNILNTLKKAVKQTKAGDTLTVFFSGHGTQQLCEEGDEDNNEDTPGFDDALCPCDYDDNGGITDDMLYHILVENLAVGAKVRAIFDCCHSGTCLDLKYAIKNSNEYIHNEKQQAEDVTDALLISGCRDNQISLDTIMEQKHTGLLTWALLQCLQQKNQTWQELLDSLHVLIAKQGEEQIPVLSVSKQSTFCNLIDL